MKPIMMSTEDVQAVLEGRKTMMRRVIKPQPVRNGAFWELGGAGWSGNTVTPVYGHSLYNRMPHKPGDVLWVRETWAKNTDYANPALYIPRGFIHKATGEYHMGVKWRSPVTMPREAARLFLRVKGVRVERIHSITVEDAVKEGVYTDTPGYWDNGWSPTFNDPDSGGEPNYINGFKMEWDARNAKRGYGWDSNPWVWVYTFERITKEEAEHGH